MDLRIKNLKKSLADKKFDAILISNQANIFYLSGISFFDASEHEGFILITKNKNYLITSSLYSEAASLSLKNFKLLEVRMGKTLEDNLKEVAISSKLKNVAFEENSLTVSEYASFKKVLPLKPSGEIIQSLRQIKDKAEIEKINKACEITDEAFKYILRQVKTGVTEIEIANKIKRYFEDLGLSQSFSPVIAFGSHSSMPHHISNNTKLRKNQIVLMDFGVKFEGYCSDFTRTVFFGRADGKFKKIYSAVLDSQTNAFNYLNSTKNPSLLKADKDSRYHILSLGFPSIPHSLGHGVGVEVHDGLRLSPASKYKAQNDMVFSLEPGIYVPGYGGVRIEDIVIYKNGVTFLTHSNRDLIEI